MAEQKPEELMSDPDDFEDDPRYESGEETIDESGRNPTQQRIDEEFEPDDAA